MYGLIVYNPYFVWYTKHIQYQTLHSIQSITQWNYLYDNIVLAMVFPVCHVQIWELNHKELVECHRSDAFELWC